MIIVKYISDCQNNRCDDKHTHKSCSSDKHIEIFDNNNESFNDIVNKINKQYKNSATSRDRIQILEISSTILNETEIIPRHIVR